MHLDSAAEGWDAQVTKYVFHRASQPPAAESEANCSYTFPHLLPGNTTNMRAHLDRDHKGVCDDEKGTSEVKREPKGQTKQTKITGFTQESAIQPPLPRAKQEAITKQVGRFVVKTLQPLSITDDQYFRDLLKEAEPRYQPICRDTLKDRLKKEKKEVEAEIKKEISGKAVAITHDSWTSLNTESYETVTASYIDENWDLKIKVLETLKVEGNMHY